RGFLGLSETDFVQGRKANLVANTKRFLAARDLDLALLRTKVLEQYPGSTQVLMTSSPVQGLATPTSDIDLVSVTTDTLSANRMATQIYVGDHHCEVVAVSPEELERTLGSMRE